MDESLPGTVLVAMLELGDTHTHCTDRKAVNTNSMSLPKKQSKIHATGAAQTQFWLRSSVLVQHVQQELSASAKA